MDFLLIKLRRTTTMDIATLLESHRRHTLAMVSEQEYDSEQELANARYSIGIVHDRATTKTLLDLYRNGQTGPNGELKPLGQAALTTPPPKPSHRVKAGSKAAKARAIKAGETRRKNIAAKQNTTTQAGYQTAAPINDTSAPALSPATHLAPRPPEGGAA